MAGLHFGEAVSQDSLCAALAAGALPRAEEISWQGTNPAEKLAVWYFAGAVS